jgi:hypothetical protein
MHSPEADAAMKRATGESKTYPEMPTINQNRVTLNHESQRQQQQHLQLPDDAGDDDASEYSPARAPFGEYGFHGEILHKSWVSNGTLRPPFKLSDLSQSEKGRTSSLPTVSTTTSGFLSSNSIC